tara:strand:+ start:55 stop:603 length:549 start_codon:yes stop_codon:yes gene_type:complete
LKEEIKQRFLNKRHKWIWFNIDTNEFYKILDVITENIKTKDYKSKDAIDLANCFKFQEKAFVKFIKTVGRKNFTCLCQIIDKNNNKIEFNLTPEELLNSYDLSDTPKSLKLYKTSLKEKGKWKKPNDGFIDPIEYPPVEEELTELGYQMYKDWQEEINRSGLSSEEYKKKLFGVSVIYKRSF